MKYGLNLSNQMFRRRVKIYFLIGEIIRILHGCEVRIENSVPRVTVWHQEALLSDAKQGSRGTEFSIRTEHIFDSFSCIAFDFECSILKVAFITTYNDVDVGLFLNNVTVTS